MTDKDTLNQDEEQQMWDEIFRILYEEMLAGRIAIKKMPGNDEQ